MYKSNKMGTFTSPSTLLLALHIGIVTGITVAVGTEENGHCSSVDNSNRKRNDGINSRKKISQELTGIARTKPLILLAL